MPNDIPDWTGQQRVNIRGGVSNVDLGDVGAPSLALDSGAETITTSGTIFSSDAVMASLKPAAGQEVALVGVAGAFKVGTNSHLAPAFGQATTAGNCLVGWVYGTAVDPVVTGTGWVKLVQVLDGNARLTLWARPNCGSAEAAPVWDCAGGTFPMGGQLAEFSGVATSTPLDQFGTNSQSTGATTITVSNPAVDVGFGDLVLMATFWAFSVAATATFSATMSNAVSVVHVGTNAGNPTAGPLSFSYGIVPPSTVVQPLGVAPWDYDVTATAAPVTGSAASVVLAATPGKAYRANSFSFHTQSVTAVAEQITPKLLDGASSIWTALMGEAATIAAADHLVITGVAYKGTVGNSMTAQFNGGTANVNQTCNLGAYLR